jgi:uncharacterized protein YodC (DUF2158 family)
MVQLQTGDIVRLNSGGPDMTVVAVGKDVEVLWMSELAQAYTGNFPAGCLMLIAPRETILERQMEG